VFAVDNAKNAENFCFEFSISDEISIKGGSCGV
jgi:hypothetical protein